MNIKETSKKLFCVVFICLVSSLTACVTTNVDGSKTTKTDTSNKDKADIYTQLAVSYMEKKQYETAQKEVERALSVMPDHSQANYIMGLLMVETKQYDKVGAFMTKAVESNPKNSNAAHDFGTFLCQTGEEMRAVEYFDQAISNPYFRRSELSWMRAGECLYKAGKAGDAEKYLKRSLQINPRLKASLFGLAKIKYEEQSYLSARAYIERFFAINKPQPAALLLGFQIESKLNANDVAQKYRIQLLDKFPASAQARSLRNRS